MTDRENDALRATNIDQAAEIEKLKAAITRQAGASKTLRKLTLDEVLHLKDKDRSEYAATKTVNSEREANAILTDEVETQAAEIERLRKHAARIDRLFTACNVLSEASEPKIDDNGNGYIVVPAFEFIQFEVFLSDYAALAQEAQTNE